MYFNMINKNYSIKLHNGLLLIFKTLIFHYFKLRKKFSTRELKKEIIIEYIYLRRNYVQLY